MSCLSLFYMNVFILFILLVQEALPGSHPRHAGRNRAQALQPGKQNKLWGHWATPPGSLAASKHTRKHKNADRAQAEVALTSRAASRSAPRSSMTRTTSLWPICDAIHRGAVPSFKRKKGAEKFGFYIVYSRFDCQNLPTGMDELQFLNKILRHGRTNAECLPEARGSSLYEIRAFLAVE